MIQDRLDCGTAEINCTKCFNRYTGDLCEIDTFSNSLVVFLFFTNQFISFSGSGLTICWAIYGWYYKVIKWKEKWYSVASLTIYLLVFSLLVRVFAAVDLFGFLRIYPVYLEIAVRILALYLSVCCLVFSLSAWFEVIRAVKRLKVEVNMLVPKIMTIVAGLVSLVVITIAMILGVVTEDWLVTLSISNVAVGILVILTVIFLIVYLFIVSDTISVLSNGASKNRIKRMNLYIIATIVNSTFSVFIPVFLIILRAFFSTNDTTYAPIYLTISLITRIVETINGFLVILLIYDWIPYMIQNTQLMNSKQK